MLLDEMQIHVTSGKGGDGASTFRREKHVPFGGPDGGNGGKGGSVYIQVNEQLNTLLDIGESRMFKAFDGAKGSGGRSTGRSGKDVVVSVPKGTLVKTREGQILADLTKPGQRYCAARGGFAGKGNFNYKSSTNQVPTKVIKGGEPEVKELLLELKLMADVGLVGFPNAGKSSLVNKISSGKPKVGDYPFTTLAPVLGIVPMTGYGSFVIADIPGLLEGAAEGKGLGHQFLKHIERTTILLFVLDGWELDAYDKFLILRKELESFHPELKKKPFVVVLNKSDLGVEDSLQKFKEMGQKVFVTSAFDGKGTKALIKELESYVRPTQEIPWGDKGSW
jgi:GTP-binding protein